MKYILLASVLLLSACSTPVPVKQQFPVAPEVLLEKCPNLHKAADNETNITELLKVVVRNYGMYYECASKQEGWTDWYTKQKSIFEKVNK
jgi:hypothetical protein